MDKNKIKREKENKFKEYNQLFKYSKNQEGYTFLYRLISDLIKEKETEKQIIKDKLKDKNFIISILEEDISIDEEEKKKFIFTESVQEKIEKKFEEV